MNLWTLWLCKKLKWLNAGQQAGMLLLEAVVFYAALKLFNDNALLLYLSGNN